MMMSAESLMTSEDGMSPSGSGIVVTAGPPPLVIPPPLGAFHAGGHGGGLGGGLAGGYGGDQIQTLMEDGLLAEMEEDLAARAAVPDKIAAAVAAQASTMSLTHCALEELPDNLGGVAPCLRRLTLRHNLLPAVPPAISALAVLTELDLGSNRITALGTELVSCSALTRLSLSSNHLTGVPACLQRLAALTALDLSNNLIDAVPAWVLAMPALTTLVLQDNYHISHLPDAARHPPLPPLRLTVSNHPLLVAHYSPIGAAPSSKRGSPSSTISTPTAPAPTSKAGSSASIPAAAATTAAPPAPTFPTPGGGCCGGAGGGKPARALPGVEVVFHCAFPDLIFDGVFLGGVHDAANPRCLRALGVTHVLAIGTASEVGVPPNTVPRPTQHRVVAGAGADEAATVVVRLALVLDDEDSANATAHFATGQDFIDAARAAKGGLVLVHCTKGVSRSPTVLISWLMAREGMTLAQARGLVERRHPRTKPNRGFELQLARYDAELAARRARGEDADPSSPMGRRGDVVISAESHAPLR